MAGVELMPPSVLYNLLQQRPVYPSVSDSNYILLLDARSDAEFAEAHIVTAKRSPRSEDDSFRVPYEAELECKEHVIVYDGHTSNLEDVDSLAFQYANFLSVEGSKNPVKILKGGYEVFSAEYPFLRTKKILYMPQELDEIKTYPIEIIPNQLYMSSHNQAVDKKIQKDVKIKAHVAVTTNNETFFPMGTSSLHQIPVEDTIDADLGSHLEEACNFIDAKIKEGVRVLVYSDLGIGRCSSVVLAYLISKRESSLKDAFKLLLDCQKSSRPNRGFVKQLSQWEEKFRPESVTNIEDPNF